MYIDLTFENFDKEVIQSKIPVLVDFWAEWCEPCKALMPYIDELAKQKEGKLKVCKLNVEKAEEITTKYTVTSIPTLIIFKDGKVMDRKVGLISKYELHKLVNKYI